MSKSAWVLVAIAYLIIGVGLVIALSILQNQQDTLEEAQERLEEQQQELAVVAGVYCQVFTVMANDDATGEVFLTQLANGSNVFISPTCDTIVSNIRD